MRSLGVVLCSLLLAGIINATVTPVALTAGEDYTFNVIAANQDAAVCLLTKPNNVVLEFTQDEPSKNGDRYLLQPATNVRPCAVTLKSVQPSDGGVWIIAYQNQDGFRAEASYELTVTGTTGSTEGKDPIWLNPIDFPTRLEQTVHISLSKKEYSEECYILTPDGENVKVADANIEGVEIHGSSDYVSCRITIGPMAESLLGNWTLCGRRNDQSGDQVRCQQTSIRWNNVNRPSATWDVDDQPMFNHVVHLGGTLSPVVQSFTNRVSCHIITPDGEDLYIDADSTYPNLRLVATAETLCRVAIGPITREMLKEWTLYGRFNGILSGFYEERLPMKLIFYDEENPYDQAYNVTKMSQITRTVNLDTTTEVDASTNTGNVEQCLVETPSGDVVEQVEGASFVTVEGRAICRLAIGPITEQLLGTWTVIGKFVNNDRFIEIHQTIHILQEDPENPIIDEDRTIQNQTAQLVSTEIGSSHNIVIFRGSFIEPESCHVRTPDGLQYRIMDGFNIAGVTVMESNSNNNIECGITVDVLSEDQIGTWTLIGRSIRLFEPIERRLPYTISVEEIVEAVPKQITIVEGMAVNIRLVNPTDQYDTCELYGPDGSISSHAKDPANIQQCGFTITSVSEADKGTLEIVYGKRKIYRARIVVDIIAGVEAGNSFATSLELVRDRVVNMTVGPADAIYCSLVDPKGVPVFNGFGPCQLALDRVTLDHFGAWEMSVATVGQVFATVHQIYVNVRESAGKPVVTTSVYTEKPLVALTCKVETEATVNACKFRDPQGRILLSTGVTEGRFTTTGFHIRHESPRTYECGVQIDGPEISDMGLWRCAFETDEDTHFGFLTVICPFAITLPGVSAVVQQFPILRAHRTEVDAVEGEPVTMSCQVEAVINYCYFRFQNGTVFTVSPGMSSNDMEYVGAGFDAGECGVRFHSMKHRDSGSWSCHVGLVDDHEEQRANIQLGVQLALRTDHRRNDPIMVVEGLVHGARALDYCRFVRMDGFGFTTGNFPENYIDTGSVSHGICQLTITNPTMLELHPWTVVAKVRGQDFELSRDTMDSIVITGPTPEGEVIEEIEKDPEHEHEHDIHDPMHRNSPFGIAFYVLLAIVLVAILLGVWLGPKRNRQWTRARASAIRSSFARNSIKKEPLPAQEPPKYDQTV